MPTTYTHDKFGKDVYKKLPEHIKAVIRKGKGVYRIGQHGPDIFFYYKPICLPQSRINKIGPQMHKEPAFGSFRRGYGNLKSAVTAAGILSVWICLPLYAGQYLSRVCGTV